MSFSRILNFPNVFGNLLKALLIEADMPGTAAHFSCYLIAADPPTVCVRGRFADSVMLSTDSVVRANGGVRRGDHLSPICFFEFWILYRFQTIQFL